MLLFVFFLCTSQSPSTDSHVKTFWQIWGQDQIACKVFPIALAHYGVQRKVGHYIHTVHKGTMTLDLGVPTSLTNMPIKEGMHSIIKCLKAQATSKAGKKQPIKQGLSWYAKNENYQTPSIMFNFQVSVRGVTE